MQILERIRAFFRQRSEVDSPETSEKRIDAMTVARDQTGEGGQIPPNYLPPVEGRPNIWK
jgi:hypothetical protein